ncbi:MAG: 16S rRNA (adenine(1518)-N(6)/adenine(1519)-N(6))-dimethyltransferase RsmA [Thermanaeromonas sp.]|uniref:16S rRNA (adenine(1518)-N(6)/adenine(1519)-N(6))- dimethyltransferase RsmA n=1 Tax=Thermanaeromonas sp. TaxID=2003697 RepID=UPI0024383318|nr:16S rRNA (adenine(1518)-N(6)/adenine(1519)-N(6))-dimethyltransferase RsmA [Thermanaeromonas sp.]MCG0277346.1 16S rRNA (adenine(1518)-N(6)/adenine(1519)-N(6))-dimethyltransferase RsmA [Thermanaeromonas sp.]
MYPAVTSPGQIVSLLKAKGLRPSKARGQNFLLDANIARKIAEEAALAADDVVVEIGPGLGALTRELAQRAGRVIGIEIDRNLVQVLREILEGQPNVVLVEGDALKINFDELVGETLGMQGRGRLPAYKVVANLPYYITSPLLVHLLGSGFNIERLVLMVQLEVAQRLTAGPGTKDYGALTVFAQYFADIQWVMRVPRTVFFPRPEVDSAVVRLYKRPRPPVDVGDDEEFFFRVVRASFSKRRKILPNALKELVGDREKVFKALDTAGIMPIRRGETLSLEEFARLSRCLKKELGRG